MSLNVIIGRISELPEQVLVRQLVDQYHALRLDSPQSKAVCLRYDEGFPDAEVLERATQIMSFRWRVEVNPDTGCIWLTATFS